MNPLQKGYEMIIDKHVIDTNVLLVASSAHEASPFAPDATPVEEALLRKKVLNWLIEFEQSDRNIVYDWAWKIPGEYSNKLSDQDYGMRVFLHKIDTGNAIGVTLEYDSDGHALIADQNVQNAVTDLADRKMVAAVLAAGGITKGCELVNACDTDWYDCKEALDSAGVHVHQIIGKEWCYPKWQTKHPQ